MPVVAVKGAIVVITVVAGIAIAVYESPQVREFAEDCRRRIAVALHSLGDEINPNRASADPRFNRPEDAEGFMRSTAEPGVDADEPSRRRQREELMYWNQVRMEKMERDTQKHETENEGVKHSRSRGVSFDDFLHKDGSNENALVYQTGADVYTNPDGALLQRRGQGIRSLERGAAFANPFADEHQMDEQPILDAGLMSPQQSEMSDLYSATDIVRPARDSAQAFSHEPLVDLSEPFSAPFATQPLTEATQFAIESEITNDTLSHHSYAGAEAEDAFASIHAWADDNRNPSFYSPLPVSPQAPRSEVSDGELVTGEITPTDSVSLAGSGEDVANDNASSVGNFDVMSEDGDGISTPGSWTEVGSVVSEHDAVHQ